MGIDGIGKKPGVPGAAPPAAGESTRGEKTGRTFEVGRTDAPRAASATTSTSAAEAAGASPLERVRSGAIDVHTYLDAKVEQALDAAHLRGLPSGDLDSIRKMLRDRLSSDPALADLVKQATGVAPPASDDE